MSNRLFISVLLLIVNAPTFAQQTFVGTYHGQINGDNVELVLTSEGTNILEGTMKDSQQSYTVTATTSGDKLTGKAVENLYGITFLLDGTLTNNQLPITMTVDVFGVPQVIKVDFTKSETISTSTTTTPIPHEKIGLPPNAQNDPNLVGVWTKEELYNSGYGDNFMGGSFSQSLVFYADGSVSDGGSSTSISGSNYSGSSQSGGQGQALPGTSWYNLDNQLYLQVTQNGKTETAHLGRYYIERGKLLITHPNGNKLFLTKQ